MNPSVDLYFSKIEKWQEELEKLRMILLDCGLTEELKWGSPCYIFPVKNPGRPLRKSNIVIIGELKESCVFSFFKGALLNDDHGILIKPGENTQSARSIYFKNLRQIEELQPVLEAYIYEAIEVEKAGLKTVAEKKTEAVTEEFQKKMNEMPGLKTAFESLTPSRQKGYLYHFSQAKQSKTREARIERSMPQILRGKALY